ncbi:hypothetical protein DFH28DRAFT_393516 [Melampsora americana]|nr:hypothetical protein DFH28DRAFT_393516 [Melampsora americana]
MFWRPSNIFNLFSKSEHTENHNQPVCEDQETTPSSRIGTMAMPGANLRKKKSTRIHPSDQAPDDYGRSYARPYRPRAGGWDTGVAEDRSESRSSYQGGLSFAKGHIPSTATLPKFQKNSNAVSKTGAAVLFGNALDDINQNQNAKPPNARTRNSHLRQGSSASHDRQPTVKICGRAKGKQKANNGPIDLTLDDDPIESFSDQGDCGPHTNIRISSRPLQSSSKDKTDDPMLLRSKYNPQSRRKSQTNTDHNYLPPQNKTITKSFACKRVHLWAEEGLATLPFPDACDSSRLYVDGHAIIFEGQLLSGFRMKFTADDIEKIFTQTPPKRERFALQLRADFTWTQGTSPCGFIEQPRGWSLPASDPKKSCTPPPPGVIFFELDSGDTRASQDALAPLFDTLTVISSPRPFMLVPSLDTTWNSWLPLANQWQKPKESPLGPLSNRQSSKDDHMTRIPNSDEIEIQLQDRPKSPLPNHHKPNISSKDRHTGTSTRFTRDQPDGPDLELNETCTLNVSTRDQLMNPQPPSKGRNTIVSLPPKPTTQSSFKDFSSTEAYHTPKRTLRSSTREKANTTTTASFKPKPDDHFNESSKVTGKRTHNSVTGTAPDPQQKADSDIILVWPYESKNSVAITYADMRRLEEGEFLNDTLIEFGLQWELEKIRQRDSKISESIYLFNSFFFQKLSRKSKKKCHRRIKNRL